MVVYLLNSPISNKFVVSSDLLMSLILVYYVIYFGVIPIKMFKVGQKMKEVFLMYLVLKLFPFSLKSMN